MDRISKPGLGALVLVSGAIVATILFARGSMKSYVDRVDEEASSGVGNQLPLAQATSYPAPLAPVTIEPTYTAQASLLSLSAQDFALEYLQHLEDRDNVLVDGSSVISPSLVYATDVSESEAVGLGVSVEQYHDGSTPDVAIVLEGGIGSKLYFLVVVDRGQIFDYTVVKSDSSARLLSKLP